jgi:cell wall-associated NlpC family hydrolase
MNTRVKVDIVAHAHAVPTEEVCGLIYHTDASVHAHPCRNVSPEARAESFEIDPADYATVAAFGRVCGIYHGGLTHTNDGFSEEDLATAREMCLPMYLYAASGRWANYVPSTYHVDPVALPWIWGLFDCWEVARIHYRQKRGIYLTDYDRDETFEHAAESAIVQHIADEGFAYVPKDGVILIDDVLLFRTPGTSYPHHLAVLVAPNQMLHHRRNQLSGIDTLDGAWLRRLAGVLRYTK